MNTISILICAYNEEKNIKLILEDIMAQDKSTNISIEKIIIVSDGSTDNTNSIIESINCNNIILIKNNKRFGKALSFNIGKENVNSEYIVSIDADIRIKGTHFFIELGKYISSSYAKTLGLIGGCVEPEKEKKYNLPKIASLGSYYMNYYLRKNLNNGNNFYSAHGRCLILNRRLYKKIVLPDSPGTDQYMYFNCLRENLNFKYAENLVVKYKLPSNFNDYSKQSNRFGIAIKNMTQYFGEDIVSKEIKISIIIKIKTISLFILNHFIIFTVWLFYYFFSKIKGISIKDAKSGIWDISESTK